MADEAFPSPLDFYETDKEDVLPLVPFLRRPRVWVDLGCGRGALGKILYEEFGVQGVGIEFLPERASQALNSGAYAHVVRGDIADADLWAHVKANVAHMHKYATGDRSGGVLVLYNPPFQQWELFADRARELRLTEYDESAALLPSMAFERKKTKTTQFVRRAEHVRAIDAGRYDLANRSSFWRMFVKENGETHIARKGSANSNYAWLMNGQAHAGRWRWLENVGTP